MRVLALAAVLVSVFCTRAGAEDPVRTQAIDTFPAALGYAFLGVVSTAGGILGGVIAKLYWANTAREVECAAAAKADALALANEKDARREEAERLLREQQAILREVLASTNAKTIAYDKLTDAVQGQTLAVTNLMHLVGEK